MHQYHPRFRCAWALWIGLAITSSTILMGADGARAESPDESVAIEEIVVTARKREESLQDVPLSVSAFNESAIENAYGENIGEFSKMAPNVTLARQPYAGNALFAGMRGIVFGDLEKSFEYHRRSGQRAPHSPDRRIRAAHAVSLRRTQ